MNKPTKAQARLTALEKEIKKRGVRLAYERLQFAGLRLKSGLCWFRGEYYLFVDRLKTVPERTDLISSALEELNELEAKGRLENPDSNQAAAPATEPFALEPATDPSKPEDPA